MGGSDDDDDDDDDGEFATPMRDHVSREVNPSRMAYLVSSAML